MYKKYNDKDNQINTGFSIPRIKSLFKPIRNNNQIKTTLDKSDFDFDFDENTLNHNINDDDLIDFDEIVENPSRKDEYRVNYPLEQSSIVGANDFLKSLEGKIKNNFAFFN